MSTQKQGDFYVEYDDCMWFNVCLPMAPGLLKSPDDTYVFKQPKTDNELAQIFSASQICPVSAIKYRGKDKFLKKHLEGTYHCMNRDCSPKNCPCFDKYVAERSKN